MARSRPLIASPEKLRFLTATPQRQWLIVAITAIVGAGGALYLGELIDYFVRSGLELIAFDLHTALLHVALLLGLACVGTGLLALGVFFDSNPARISLVAAAIVLPLIVDVVDLTIRYQHLVRDLELYWLQQYGG